MKKITLFFLCLFFLYSCDKQSTDDVGLLFPLEIPETFTEVVEKDEITVNASPVALSGTRLQKGDILKDIKLDHKADYFDQVEEGSISDYSGYRLIQTVPSLDTPVCTQQTKQLEAAAKIFPENSFLIISNDTPFALQRFCTANSISNIIVLSDARTREFGIQNGLFLPDYGLLTRSIMIIDENMKIVYIDYAEEVTEELDLRNALAYLQHLQK